MSAKYGIQLMDGGGRVVQGTPMVLTVQLLDLTGALVTDAPQGGTWEPVSGATVSGVLTAPSGDLTQNLSFNPLSTAGWYQASFAIAQTAEVGLWQLAVMMVNGADVQNFPKRGCFEVTSQ